MDNHFCERCRHVSPRSISVEHTHTTPNGTLPSRFGYDHGTFEQLGDSAKTCPMCNMLLAALNSAPGMHKLKKGKEHRLLLSSDKYIKDHHIPRSVAGMTALVTNSNLRAYFHVFAEPGSPAALSGDITGRDIRNEPDSPQSLSRIQSWLGECIQGHPECGLVPLARASSESSPLVQEFPSRLIYIEAWSDGDHDEPASCILVPRSAAVHDQGRYIALSYCWGPLHQQLRTLKANLTDHMKSIPLETMPLTLRHAVVAARKLKICYLWIDALCIVQDDAADWNREAPQMGLIYQNAYCTIAAAGSSSSSSGLFHRRTVTGQIITLPYNRDGGSSNRNRNSSCSTSSAQTAVMHITPVTADIPALVQNTAWNSRGWVLQERNLSRRIILFTTGQTFFECGRRSLAEDGRALAGYQHKRLGSGDIHQGDDWAWCGLVADYTARALTCAEDKLFAVAGLAANMGARQASNRRFCAGIGVDALGLHLMWRSEKGGMRKPVLSEGRELEAEGLFQVQVQADGTRTWKRAPSWSWAALEGPVIWEPSALEARVVCELGLVGERDVVHLAPDDVRLREAQLTFRGLVVEVSRSRRTLVDDGGGFNLEGQMVYVIDINSHPTCYALLGTDDEALGWAVFDEAESNPGPYVAAVISYNSDSDDQATSGGLESSANALILEMSEDSTYNRVGMGELSRLNKAKFSETTITLS
ncbi:heterokaryon incompatibility protein-domain-containing protein [Podospora didyma]|uniref:Heterokaryon incompatibility protein-domain-containing protein n=1 Tax=Podospora didyma TaxID=330526 RepID=A0AAE0NZ05_9PEZI|nr:heterokaryon incompatibility protein-domain-containing protein [Podospora didyma]